MPGAARRPPGRGEFLAVLGAEPAEDLAIGDVEPAWRRAVLAGWLRGLLSAERTVELLPGQITVGELPEREARAAP